jgi:hypothetical protein
MKTIESSKVLDITEGSATLMFVNASGDVLLQVISQSANGHA